MTWTGAHGWATALGPVEIGALLAAVVLAEQVAITVGRRTTYTFAAPLLVLAGLLGGPMVGLMAGALCGAADLHAVWRKRLTYAGLSAIQGFAAGAVGLLPHSAPGSATLVTALAVAVVFAISTAGRALVYLDRGVSDIGHQLAEGIVAEVAESLIAVPVLALLVRAYPEAPGLVLASIGSLLAGLGLLQVMRRRHERELSAALGSALTDPLTGAPNRLAFEEALQAEHSRILRGALPAGLFLVDVDHFKSVNDRYGHQIGDRALIEVVERLRRALRRGDVVCRWGGEELAVLAPGLADTDAIVGFAERLREVVGSSRCPCRSGRSGSRCRSAARRSTAASTRRPPSPVRTARSTARSGGATRPSSTCRRRRPSSRSRARNASPPGPKGTPVSPENTLAPTSTRVCAGSVPDLRRQSSR